MSTRMSSPPAPLFLFLLPFLTLSLVRPRRRLSPAPTAYCARRCCQGWPLLQRPPPSGGPRPLQQSSTTARLDGSGRLHSCLLSVLSVSARYSDNGCCVFGRPCYEVHGACDNRINLYPAAPIRLAKVLLAWTIVQEGWDSS